MLLHRRLHSHHWLGMVLICAGAALVGASSIVCDGADPRRGAQQAAAGGGGGGDGNSAGPPVAGLRRLLLLHGLGAEASSTAPNPLLGNVLVVTAQVGWGCGWWWWFGAGGGGLRRGWRVRVQPSWDPMPAPEPAHLPACTR